MPLDRPGTAALATHDRARRVPARLSRHLRHARHGRERPRGGDRGRSVASDDARHALHQGCALPRPHLFGSARPASVAARRAQGRRKVRAHQLGRGTDHHRRALQGHRGVGRRTAGDPAVQLRGHHGPAAIRLDGSALLSQARRIAARSHDLLVGRQGRIYRDDRRGHRDRPRAIRKRAAHPDLGFESHRLQPAFVESGAGGEAPRREADRHRPVPQPDCGEMPRASRLAARAPTRRSRSE